MTTFEKRLRELRVWTRYKKEFKRHWNQDFSVWIGNRVGYSNRILLVISFQWYNSADGSDFWGKIYSKL